MNRDELRSRPRALRPTAVDLEAGVRAAWPTDAQAGGTWIAASDRGLVLGLLNGNPAPYPDLPPDDTLISRGLIVPGLIASAGARDAVERVGALDVRRYAPFRLIAADRAVIADAVWDGSRLRVTRRALRAACFVSSGLGDRLVSPRLGLFRRFMTRHGSGPEVQDAYHRHRWDERPEISVMMSRSEARTVSVTTVEVSSLPARNVRDEVASVRMIYRDDAGEAELCLHPVQMPEKSRLDKAPPARERSAGRAEPARAVGGRAPW